MVANRTHVVLVWMIILENQAVTTLNASNAKQRKPIDALYFPCLKVSGTFYFDKEYINSAIIHYCYCNDIFTTFPLEFTFLFVQVFNSIYLLSMPFCHDINKCMNKQKKVMLAPTERDLEPFWYFFFLFPRPSLVAFNFLHNFFS